MSESRDACDQLAIELALLRPAAPGIGLERLLVEASRVREGARCRRWRNAAFVASAAAAALALLQVLAPAVTRTVVVEVHNARPEQATPSSASQRAEADSEAPPTLPRGSWHELQQAVLQRGLDGLPDAQTPGPLVHEASREAQAASVWEWRTRIASPGSLFVAGGD